MEAAKHLNSVCKSGNYKYFPYLLSCLSIYMPLFACSACFLICLGEQYCASTSSLNDLILNLSTGICNSNKRHLEAKVPQGSKCSLHIFVDSLPLRCTYHKLTCNRIARNIQAPMQTLPTCLSYLYMYIKKIHCYLLSQYCN